MCTITWEAGQHRLRLTGSCAEGDRAALEEALEAVDEAGQVRIIDLVAVESLSPAVAGVIVAACDRAGGGRISVLRRQGSEADRVLREQGV